MLVLRGRAFHEGRLEPLSLGIEDERIVAIRKILRGDVVRDYGDALLLPGCIDMHVHFRDPGYPEKEDFAHGTQAAALGGVTGVLDMPNTRPPVTTPDAFEAKVAAVGGRAAIDYGLLAAPRSASSALRLSDAVAFKVYMAETTGGLEIDEEALREVLEVAREQSKLTVVHAEDPREFRRVRAAGLDGHRKARPKESEVSALKKLAIFGGSAPMHIAHITCVEALRAVPTGATTEATPHHLVLDAGARLGAFGKVNPPLRSPEDRDGLWKAFSEGRIDVIASDHAPHAREEKEVAFDEAPAGVPGVATSLPILLRRAKAGDVSLDRIVTTMATRPAGLLGLDKGSIEVGREADVVVVDPRRIERIRARRLRYKCGWTPFEGVEGCFPRAVYLRGHPVVEDGEPGAEGQGRLITVTKR